MQFFRGLHNTRPLQPGCVLTIGNFDGVHLGHQRLLDKLKQKAAALALPSAVMIFEPQPKEHFDPQGAPARLCSLAEKIQLFKQQDIDALACMAFNGRFRNLTAQQFVEQVLVEGLNVKALIIGDDFRFGCDRSGDFEFLQQAGEQFGFEVQDTQTVATDGERISSTRVRDALAQSDLALAKSLIGREFSINGRIAHGQKLGRTLGVPTANVILKRDHTPLVGVFAVEVVTAQGRFNGVANIGMRPTVGGTVPILEAHLFDFAGDLYGQRLDVVFKQKIRDEKRFNGLDELKAAIYQDIKLAKAYFNEQ
ncbi:bifunctional riboflavin kinase/FAD synthetase [Bermanella sp. R86510]|uniref:bifunctional riboflavin kinase/FAD synthetase n=1 Tax=unclassified Bermanella TaxID=2627862 RepID=UPI0037C817A6